jgi:hypothetical protein
LFDRYNAGQLKPNKLSKQGWYDLASWAAQNEHGEIKTEIYDKVIPQLSDYDLVEDGARTKINRLDGQRRDGETKAAHEGLLAMGRPEGVQSLIEWLEAVRQCLCRPGPQQNIQESIDMGREEVLLSQELPEPDDKFIHRLTGFLSHKALLGQFDDEYDKYLALYKEPLSALKGTDTYPRSYGYSLVDHGLYNQHSGNAELALEYFNLYFDNSELERLKAVATLYYLPVAFQAGITGEQVNEKIKYFIENQHKMQPGDITFLQKEYDQVISWIVNKLGL